MRRLAPLALFLVGCSSCSAAQTAAGVTAVEDISDAVCTELEANQQTDTAYVQFICSLVPKTGGAPKTFKVKIKSDTAKKFAADHCAGTSSASPAKVSP